MAFQYTPFVNPYAASIGDLLAHQNDARAHAAEVIGAAQAHAQEVVGQANAGAIQGVASTVAALPQQILQQKAQAQETQIRQGQIDDLNQKRSDLVALDKAYAAPGGRDAILAALPGHLRPIVAKQLSDADEQGAKAQEAQLTADKGSTDYVTGLAETIAAHNYDPIAAQGFISHAKETFKGNPSLLSQIGQVEQAVQANPTPESVKAIIDPILKVRDQALVDKARGAKYAPGDVSPILGPTPPAGPKLEAVAPGGTVLDTSTQQPVFTAPAKPPPLEEQYLKAVADGDKTASDNIAKTWADKAAAERDPNATAQLAAIRTLSQQEAQARLDSMDTGSDKNQQKFEQEYRTVLQRGLSSRSGGLGLEDAKVQQANHLKSLLDQNFDPKTGEWNIPRVQLNELALGLARLTSPGGQAGEGMLKEFQQRTAKGDLAGALTYLTGEPVPANTQAITKYLADSIDRQGKTAEQNREGEMAYLRGLAPTDLAEDRRQKLEATSLNPLRQSRIAVDDSGNKRLFVSVDGGKTWK